MTIDEKKFWDLNFSIEVSARYHEWRRAFFERWTIFVRIVTAVGAVLSLIGLTMPTNYQLPFITVSGPTLIAIGSAAVAIVSILDFATGANEKALIHVDLYRRFKQLQETTARHQFEWEKHIAEWEAEAQSIRRDEPPTLWALYMISWNQAVARRDPKHMAGARKVNWWQQLTKNFIHHLPFNFPEAEPASAKSA